MYKNQFCLNIGTDNNNFKQAFAQKYGKGLEQMSATAFAQLSLMLDILQNKNSDMSEIIKNNNSIFGQLTLDGRSIRYLPIVETVE